MSSGGTIATCGGNGPVVGPYTLTFWHHKRMDTLLWHTTEGLDPIRAAILDHFVETMRKAIAEGVERITGDAYHLHTDHPPAP